MQGYKVYYTTNPNQPEASWDSQMVDNSELTTISELTPLAIYTVRVQAFTSMGAGPMSNPVKVKMQQGLCLFNLNFSNNSRFYVHIVHVPSNLNDINLNMTLFHIHMLPALQYTRLLDTKYGMLLFNDQLSNDNNFDNMMPIVLDFEWTTMTMYAMCARFTGEIWIQM